MDWCKIVSETITFSSLDFRWKTSIFVFFNRLSHNHGNLGGGFNDFLFSPLFGEDEPILTNIVQRGWNHQLEMENGYIWTNVEW